MPNDDRAATASISETPHAPEPNTQISYARDAMAWYRRRRPQRWIILLAIVVLGIWLSRTVPPIWTRYRFFQAQQYLVNHPWTPQGAQVRFSASQPYAHALGAFDTIEARFWAMRMSAGLGSFTITSQAGVSTTPLFSGVLRTAAGQQRLTQISAASVNVWGRTGIQLIAIAVELRNWPWILGGYSWDTPGTAHDDFSIASVVFSPEKFREAVVTGGTMNPKDPSEVDITLTLDGKTVEIPIHVADASPSGYPVGAATVHPTGGRVVLAAPIGEAAGKLPYSSGMWGGFWAWPSTGK